MDIVQQAIAAFEAGERHAARRHLTEAVQARPDDVLAWRWLADVVESPVERRVCLERLVALQDDQDVRDELDHMGPPPRPVPAPSHIINAAKRIGSTQPARASWRWLPSF